MADFHFTVDTEPMAEEVGSVANHVNATTGAIIAMKVATVAAEQRAADEICETVDNGFHALILSQVAQKAAKAKAIVDSKLLELVHYQTSLLNVRAQMEKDFYRIKSRYTKLFSALDVALRMRIMELDKAAYLLATHQNKQMIQRVNNAGVQPCVHSKDSLASSQILVNALLRFQARRLIMGMGRILGNGFQLRRSMAHITHQKSISQEEPVYVPMLVLHADDLNLSISRESLKLPIGIKELANNLGVVHSHLEQATWHASTAEDKSKIAAKCKDMLAQMPMSERTNGTFQILLGKQNWLSLQGAQG